jgi:hypothetical protein
VIAHRGGKNKGGIYYTAANLNYGNSFLCLPSMPTKQYTAVNVSHYIMPVMLPISHYIFHMFLFVEYSSKACTNDLVPSNCRVSTFSYL